MHNLPTFRLDALVVKNLYTATYTATENDVTSLNVEPISFQIIVYILS